MHVLDPRAARDRILGIVASGLVPIALSVGVFLAGSGVSGGLAHAAPGPGRATPATVPPVTDYRVTHWTTAQGLPQNSVNDIVHLENGDLWVATFGGLARFDGERFHVKDMATDAGLPTHRIIALAAAGPTSLWYLSQQGHLGLVQRGAATAVAPPASPSVDALALLVSRDGHLYFKSADGGLWQTTGARPWQRVDAGLGRMQSLAETEDGALWAVWGTRLVRLTGLDGSNRPAPLTLPDHDVAAFRRAGGGLWLGIGHSLARVAGDRLTRLEVQPPFEQRVTAVVSAEGDALWVAAGNEVSLVAPHPDGSWRRSSLPLGIEARAAVRSLTLGRDGSLWVGTDGRGLYRVNRPPARRFSIDLAPTQVSGLASDGAGGAFVVSGCRGLFHVSAEGTVRSVLLRDPSDVNAVPGDGCGIALAPGRDGTTWVRSGPRLFEVSGRHLGVRRVRVNVPFDEGPIVAGPDGALWVVSRQGTVHRLSRDGRVERQWSFPAPLMSASVGADGALWVGGDGQVFRVTGEGEESVGPGEQMPRGLVRDVLVEADGTAWIGTYGGGIGRLRAGLVTRLTVDQGLPDNSVSRILDDGRGRLWISTNRGVAVCEKAHLHDVADGRLRALAPVVFGPERGVSEANFGNPAGFAGADGALWFGTIDGAVRIDSRRFPFNADAPVVAVDGITADDGPIEPGPVAELPALTSRVRIDLGVPGLLYPELSRFRFRVEGVDPDWIDVGPQRDVTWTPPGPGRYRLAFGARNEDGVWSTTPTTVAFEVRPAWWQTTAARVAGVFGAVFAALVLFRWREKGVERRHAEELRRLDEQRAAAEHAASLRAQLEHVSRVALVGELAANLAHEVRQPIGAMVNNAEAGRRHLSKYLQQPGSLEAIFDDIVRDGMRASEIVRGVRNFLRPQETARAPIDLSALVREMLPLVRRELQEHRVDLSLDLATRLPPVEGVPVQLGQLVVNLVLNACEALGAVPPPRRLTIATAERDGRVNLEVIDNGPGPSPDVADRIFEPFVSTKPDGLGMGLAICRSIAEAHDGRLAASRAEDGFAVVLSLPPASTRAAR